MSEYNRFTAPEQAGVQPSVGDTPQHSGPPSQSTSQDTFVFSDSDRAVEPDSQRYIPESEIERPIPQTYMQPIQPAEGYVESSHQPHRTFSEGTLVIPNSEELIRYDWQKGVPPAQQAGSHAPTVENTGQYSEHHRALSQSTIGSVDRKPVMRRPVPAQEKRDQYFPIQQNDVSVQPTDDGINRPQHEKERKVITPFAIYGLLLLAVFLGSLGFWIQGRRRPIFFSRNRSRWMSENPKTTTMLWTSAAALLAWCTLWLHACSVSLMARKLIVRGAKISTIEGWVKLSNNGAMLDRHRPWLSLYTALAAVTTAALTVGFAGLLTPVPLTRSNRLYAKEVDFTMPEFKLWYADPTNRTFSGCMWYTKVNEVTGKKYTFPTCPFQDDNSLVLQAGRAAVEAGFGLNSITKIGDVNFNGTTGGTLPIGRNGFLAFDTLQYDIEEDDFPAVYNYSTILQGSTIDVTCEETEESPIVVETLFNITTSNPIKTNMHARYNFSAARSGGLCQWDYTQDFIVPQGGNLMSFMCGSENTIISPVPPLQRFPLSPFHIFFRPFGDYESGNRGLQLRNVTCTVAPRMTLNKVTYNSLTNDFTSRVIETITIPNASPTDFEAMDAIYQVFWYGISKQGNIVADTIVSLRHQNEEYSDQSMGDTFENILRGFYEMEMTSLRLYYSANNPPGSREIHGRLTHFRMGYNGSIEALYALGPLAVVVCMGLVYLIWGAWLGGGMFEFNPTRASSLLVASSQGGLSKLNLGKTEPTTGKYPDESSLQNVKVKFGELPHGQLGLSVSDEGDSPRCSSESQRSNV